MLFKKLHKWNRESIPNYIEIFIDTPLEELIEMDPKGLYKKYNSGEIKNIAGMDLEVDFPIGPDIHLKWSSDKTIDSMYQDLLSKLKTI